MNYSNYNDSILNGYNNVLAEIFGYYIKEFKSGRKDYEIAGDDEVRKAISDAKEFQTYLNDNRIEHQEIGYPIELAKKLLETDCCF